MTLSDVVRAPLRRAPALAPATRRGSAADRRCVIGITLGAALASLVGRVSRGRCASRPWPGHAASTGRKALMRSRWPSWSRSPAASLSLRAGQPRLPARAGSGRDTREHAGGRRAQAPGASGSSSRTSVDASSLPSPIVGTGWYPELPPKEYDALPAGCTRTGSPTAAARTYFPPADGQLHPADGLRPGPLRARCWPVRWCSPSCSGPRSATPLRSARALAARRLARPARSPTCAPAWTASMLGVLAGIALFGGATVAALFWLTLGAVAALVAVAPAVVPRRAL